MGLPCWYSISCQRSKVSRQWHMGKTTNQNPKSFWLSVPGFLTALAGFISAFTGLYIAIHNSSSSSPEKPPAGKVQADDLGIVSRPSPKQAGLQVVRIKSALPQGTMASYGFFTPKGFIVVATHTIGKDGSASVTWTSNGVEQQQEATTVGPGSYVPEVTLLRLVGVPLVARDLPIRLSGSLQPGEKVARYIGPDDTTPGTVKEIYGQRPIAFDSGTRTLTRLLIATEIAGIGDSGAPVIDSEGRIVGMVFGASNTEAICIPIEDIKASFFDAF